MERYNLPKKKKHKKNQQILLHELIGFFVYCFVFFFIKKIQNVSWIGILMTKTNGWIGVNGNFIFKYRKRYPEEN